MMSEDVRSTNGRPRASTPVVTRGTACTIRVLRRFLNSVLALAISSDTISVLSSAELPPESFIQAAAVPQFAQNLHKRVTAMSRRRYCVLRGTFRGRPAVCSGQEHPCFFCDPDWPYQQIDRSLKKRRMISFDPVAEKEKHPSTDKKSHSPNPLGQNK